MSSKREYPHYLVSPPSWALCADSLCVPADHANAGNGVRPPRTSPFLVRTVASFQARTRTANECLLIPYRAPVNVMQGVFGTLGRDIQHVAPCRYVTMAPQHRSSCTAARSETKRAARWVACADAALPSKIIVLHVRIWRGLTELLPQTHQQCHQRRGVLWPDPARPLVSA